jgi:hypothetical protein
MPFSHVKSEFQPEQLAKMTAAFDMAWPTVSAANSCDKIGLLRERLAHYIIACASGGELDPDKLKGLAIKAFTRQDATNSSAEFARAT